MTPFRVFSGWDRRQAEAAEVFAYSVRQNSSIPVEVQFLINARPERNDTWKTAEFCVIPGFQRAGVTAFTYIRFMVPFACDYEGRALFCDGCDQLCLGDVRDLAEWPLTTPIAVVKHAPLTNRPDETRARSWTSLMLMDCAQLRCWTPEVVAEAPDDRLMRLRDLRDDQIGELPEEWNRLVAIEEGRSVGVWQENGKLLHWSYLADPEGGSWIHRSSSQLWMDWLYRWLAATR